MIAANLSSGKIAPDMKAELYPPRWKNALINMGWYLQNIYEDQILHVNTVRQREMPFRNRDSGV